MRIIVLLGGDSPERDVSLHSGKNIAKSLQNLGHEIIEFDPALKTGELIDSLIKDNIAIPDLQILRSNPGYYSNILLSKLLNADIVFNGLHGGKGENGIIQALLETLEVKFTGSGSSASVLAMDKEVSKYILMQSGLPTAPFKTIKRLSEIPRDLNPLKFPVIIKPADGGSSLGHTVLKDHDNLSDAISIAFKYGSKVIIEQFFKGKEIAAGILNGQALPLVHILPKHDMYDYECKYTDGMSTYKVPADLSNDLTVRIQKHALKVYNLFNCSGYARIDFLVNETGEMVILEANTLPGMTATSLLPKAAKAAGYSFEDLLEAIIEDAIN